MRYSKNNHLLVQAIELISDYFWILKRYWQIKRSRNALAKPWFFTGPYLDILKDATDKMKALEINPNFESSFLSTNYFVPHLSPKKAYFIKY